MTSAEIIEYVKTRFFDAAEAAQMEPMDRERMEFLVRISMTSEQDVKERWQKMVADGLQSALVMNNVASRFTLEIDPGVLTFFAGLVETPGEAVMYLSYAVWATKKSGRDLLGIDQMSNVFHSGFWSEETRRNLWRAQYLPAETGGGNALDCSVVLHWLNHDLAPDPLRGRSEHLQWCKERAYQTMESDGPVAAYTSFASDMGKHPDLAQHLALSLGVHLMSMGQLKSVAEMRKWIEGFD